MADQDYAHGEQNIREQEKTWKGFMGYAKWGGGLIFLLVLLLMVLFNDVPPK